MGRIEVTTKVTNPLNGQSFERLFLVDTGAVDCMAPAAELEKIGVRRRGRSTYELADGTPKEFDWGFVEVEFMGDLATTKILFDDNNTEPLLGVVVLESCGIVVDPRGRTLRRLPAIPLKSLRRQKGKTIVKRPPHPGRIVRQECLEPLGLTVTEAAERLGVTRQALNNLVNQKSGISPEMAIRLSKAFGSSAEVWYGLQTDYDLAEAEKDAGKIKVQRITGRRAATG